ncbi:unnamed protein product [Merluccius merluccius]
MTSSSHATDIRTDMRTDGRADSCGPAGLGSSVQRHAAGWHHTAVRRSAGGPAGRSPSLLDNSATPRWETELRPAEKW